MIYAAKRLRCVLFCADNPIEPWVEVSLKKNRMCLFAKEEIYFCFFHYYDDSVT